MDLGSSTYTVLTSEMDMQVLPTHVYDPIPQPAVGLLFGRSNTTMKKIIVVPGVIDSDYGREIKNMTSSPGTISITMAENHSVTLITQNRYT